MEGRERFRRKKELFDKAVDLPPERRAAFLLDACGADLGLREEVEELLRNKGQSSTAAAPTSTREAGAADVVGRTIGPYRVVRDLGAGGMGQVYEARQEHPVARTVALKVIKHGLDGRQVLARFDVERQARP